MVASTRPAGIFRLLPLGDLHRKVIIDMRVSPNVGLPLAVPMNEEDGSNSTTMRLVEFRPDWSDRRGYIVLRYLLQGATTPPYPRYVTKAPLTKPNPFLPLAYGLQPTPGMAVA
jgi:hypothetical protein